MKYTLFSNEIKKKKYSKSTLTENYQKILIIMSPAIPHFSNECIKFMNLKENKWPTYDKSLIEENEIDIVVQIKGKKRALIKTKKNIEEVKLLEIINKDASLVKYFNNFSFLFTISIKFSSEISGFVDIKDLFFPLI